ncbi:alpha/beta fold hydrolase [Nocardia sp. SYP-A9097]|uniref:alpha/beta fold hydrolase n=1 Tax=Nocardia sp. SYP-A9097 TaxID=2663237 RepID=UPI0013299545|nr:alpha/beta hydrolase [Nocardia sp. SYP-A9097]MRH88483.1 alpha/beta fold hydrolase [Nocardia sp. SYP-A9097]
MAKIGRFKNDQARAEYLRAYDALETLWPLPQTQVDIETSFGTTHVRSSGSGSGLPLVLLPSFPGNGLQWHGLIKDLTRDRTVYAFDAIGAAGKSVQTAPFTGEADIAAWLAEVLAGLGLTRAHVLGYSQGSRLASLLALYAPERLASVTLIEPNGLLVKMKWSVLFRIMRFGIRPTEANRVKMAAWLTPGVTMNEREIACLHAALAFHNTLGWPRLLEDAELQSISTPVLAVFGGDSVAGNAVAAAERVTDLLPHGQSRIVPGMGHGVIDQAPDEVVPRVLEFLAQHDHSDATPR